LRDQLAHVRAVPGMLGQALVALSAAFLFTPLWFVVRDPSGLAQAFLRVLRFSLQ
jgi:hypothetical protein